MSSTGYHTYAKARLAIQDQFPGRRIRVNGAITLYAEYHGQMLAVTNVKADMDERARLYRRTGRAFEYRVADILITKTNTAGDE